MDRIASILKATSLDETVTGFPSFDVSSLHTPGVDAFEFPNNLRLGHAAEKVISCALKHSHQYNILFENFQIIEEGNTLGELDFIVEDEVSNELIHFELAYKFYVYDSRDSNMLSSHFIGPNRRDSMAEKIDKLTRKQFPLLHHPVVQKSLQMHKEKKMTQKLCFLVGAYLPHGFVPNFHPIFSPSIRGTYMCFQDFVTSHSAKGLYYLPSKKEWGMSPKHHKSWVDFANIVEKVNCSMSEKQSVLCWQLIGGVYSEVLVVWW